MAIRDIALFGLLLFSGQISSATRLAGPKRQWARQFLLPNATTSAEKDVSADSTLQGSLPSVEGPEESIAGSSGSTELIGGSEGTGRPGGPGEPGAPGNDRIPDEDGDGDGDGSGEEIIVIPGDPDNLEDEEKTYTISNPTKSDDRDGEREPTKTEAVTGAKGEKIPAPTAPFPTPHPPAAAACSAGNGTLGTVSRGWNGTHTPWFPCNSTTLEKLPKPEPTTITTRTKGEIFTVGPPIYSFPNGDLCTQLLPGEVSTVFSVIYTETITWAGDPSDYTPPYPDETITTPTYCKSDASESNLSSAQLVPEPNHDGYTTICETVGTKTACSSSLIFLPSFIYSMTTADPTLEKGLPGEEEEPLLGGNLESTFYVTPKNPTVVFPSSDKPPGYGKSDVTAEGTNLPPAAGGTTLPPNNPQSMKIPDTNNKNDQGGSNGNGNGNGNGQGVQFTVTADPTKVVINTVTITSLPPAATTLVTVDGGVFEINPSQIIQVGGETVDRPAPGGGLYVPNPTKTNIGGLDVQVTGTAAIIDGYTYTIGLTPSTEVVKGQTVVIGPNGIDFVSSKQTITFKAVSPEQTEVVVAGGELLTALGKSVVVIRSTTFTYGPGIAPRTEVIDDDTVVIGPSGVVFRGTTVGGDKLRGTKYEIVGGATITQLGPSRVVIGGVTYTVGPGTGKTTTEVGGETITIGPEGVIVSTLTLDYPFGPTVVTTLPSPTATAAAPAQTGDDDEDAAILTRPGWAVGILGLCIATGAWVLDILI